MDNKMEILKAMAAEVRPVLKNSLFPVLFMIGLACSDQNVVLGDKLWYFLQIIALLKLLEHDYKSDLFNFTDLDHKLAKLIIRGVACTLLAVSAEYTFVYLEEILGPGKSFDINSPKTQFPIDKEDSYTLLLKGQQAFAEFVHGASIIRVCQLGLLILYQLKLQFNALVEKAKEKQLHLQQKKDKEESQEQEDKEMQDFDITEEQEQGEMETM